MGASHALSPAPQPEHGGGAEVLPFQTRDQRRWTAHDAAVAAMIDATVGAYKAHLKQPSRHVDALEERDAAYECAHGHLPHDRTISCNCHDAVPGVKARRLRSGSAPFAEAA